MRENKYTIKREKGKHLTEIERGKIELLLKQRYSKNRIAQLIGISERTLYREIKRGMVYGLLNSDLTTRNEYIAEKAQSEYEKKRSCKQRSLKIGNNIKLSAFLEKKLKVEKYSPYAAIKEAEKAGYDVPICLKTLYNYIHKELFIDYTIKDLPYKKTYKKNNCKNTKRIRKKGGKSIEERASVIQERKELGHWEMDTVLGKKNGSKFCLLVLTERLSRKEIIKKLPCCTTNEVIKAIEKIAKQYPKTFNTRFRTITTDNGSEFMNAEALEKLGVEMFYAHSYCSWERGSNETANRLIRRFIKKGDDICNYSHKKIKMIENWINDYPRKIFAGESSNNIYRRYLQTP